MKRIGIIMFQNMRYAPFLKLYENILSSLPDITYDVIYFDRDKSLDELKDEHHIAIQWFGKGTLSAPGYERIANFELYAIKVKKILKHKHYDFLIILTTFPAVLLSNYLSKKYKNRYLVDIRDYTHEAFSPYFKRETKVINSAAMRVISSPGFINFLPKSEYDICHNIDANINMNEQAEFIKAENRTIIISYIGTVSYKPLCMKLIKLVEKDERFEFHFYGNEADGTEIGDYIKASNCLKIKYFGPFTPNQKKEIYGKSDLVFNCYGNDSTLVKYALSNKFYDGALYRKPLLVSPKTSMADCSGEFAYSLDLGNITDLNGLYQWYQTLDGEAYTKFADELVENAFKENIELFGAIEKVLKM